MPQEQTDLSSLLVDINSIKPAHSKKHAVMKERVEQKGLSIIIYANELDHPTIMIIDSGSPTVTHFVDLITEKVARRDYSWDVYRNFPINKIQLISSRQLDEIPALDVFKPSQWDLRPWRARAVQQKMRSLCNLWVREKATSGCFSASQMRQLIHYAFLVREPTITRLVSVFSSQGTFLHINLTFHHI